MATKRNQVYKCSICGNIVEVVHEGAGELVCCGKPMNLMTENTTDTATKKHVPVIEGNIVKVGSTLHPMEDSHHIEWIEATSKTGEICKKFLNPRQEPIAEFPFEPTTAREYCNLHGLWKA